MINRLHYLLHRPGRGWDPVPKAHALDYAEGEWHKGTDARTLDLLEEWLGGFAGKRVLDLGGGPGQWSVAFARKGADVTWHDISSTYREFAQRKAVEHGVDVRFSLGYLDDARMQLTGEFDLVFNRVCWNYGMSDWGFARVVHALVAPGGVGYVDTHISSWRRETLSGSARARTWINDHVGYKIGHSFPPRGRVARLFLGLPIERMLVDYSSAGNDRVIFRRPAAPAS